MAGASGDRSASALHSLPSVMSSVADARRLVELIDTHPNFHHAIKLLAPWLDAHASALETKSEGLRATSEQAIATSYARLLSDAKKSFGDATTKAEVDVISVESADPTALVRASSSSPVANSDAGHLHEAVLNAAPGIFRMERMATGVAAVLFEFVRQHKLYEAAGYASMREYAAAELGVRGESNYKHYARAGVAMWTHFGQLARRILESVAGGLQLSPPLALPTVPTVSVLRELPRALRRLDVTEHAFVLERVERGEVTYEELRSAGRPLTPGASVGAAGQTIDAETSSSPSALPKKALPMIFGDVPDLEHAAVLLRQGADVLDRVLLGWKEGPGPDTDGVLPKLEMLAVAVGRVTEQLEDNLIPRHVCSSCRGERKNCKRCEGAGWLPKVPLRQPPTTARRSRRKSVRGSGRSSRPTRSATRRNAS